MSPTMTIVMLIGAWLAVAAAMLWGVVRIARRHHPRQYPQAAPSKTAQRKQVRHANAH
ncbi:hypothetical protein [Pseudomonas sp. R5(2019)]|uniref:hypothetical protein n=1 Tax=Pseudomonas sp. R5(2019) TaxID=2697566 RepID=UPI001412F7BA|nr:hypothetical protein [Pseudomonas sp. R5(2019)]